MGTTKKAYKRVNIYLTPQDHKELNQVKEKYHLSYSTIANILTEHLRLIVHTDKYIYQDKEKAKKTSIKPRNQLLKTVEIENSIKLFTRKAIKNYILDNIKAEEKDKLTIYSKVMDGIYKDFQNTIDDNWDGNKFQRLMPKLIKQNREYYKKLLEVED